MTQTTKDIIEGVVGHFEHGKTGKAIGEIKSTMNGEFEKRLAEEKIKWENEKTN